MRSVTTPSDGSGDFHQAKASFGGSEQRADYRYGWAPIETNVWWGGDEEVRPPSALPPDEDPRVRCQCHKTRENICIESCVNVACWTECYPGDHPEGFLCGNQKFQKRQWKKHQVRKSAIEGWGLFLAEDAKEADFIIEYVGELLDSRVAELRKMQYTCESRRGQYILELPPRVDFKTRTFAIDATYQGNNARFANHSCDPNAELRVWDVLGEQRAGLFARKDIEKGEEVTWDYSLRTGNNRGVDCLCSSRKCSGGLYAPSR